MIVSLIFGDQVLPHQLQYGVFGKPANRGATIPELFVEHVEVLIKFSIGKGMEYILIVIPSTFELHLMLRLLRQITNPDKVGASFTFQ